ncbi:MFS transporter [Corynebacterium bovis]|uniref:MFS transporter n=1 Tax=Corynebacterium bovis TaxID=36808 RepID=UPI00313A2B27
MTTDATPASPAPRHGSMFSLALAVYIFTVVMVGTTMPTPLYPTFSAKFGFGASQTTLLFAVYAVGVVVALIFLGRLSTRVGRKPMILAGIVLSLASAAVFMIGSEVWLLYIGRVLSGLAAGILTSTGTVTVIENAPRGRESLATVLATAANIGGLGLGILMSGLVAQWAPGPLFTPFAVHAVLLVLAGVGLAGVVDRVRRDSSGPIIQLPGVPPEARHIYGVSAIGAVVGFTTSGLFSAVVPGFVKGPIGISSPAVIGVTVCLFFLSSAAAQIILSHHSDRSLVTVGSVASIVGLVLLIVALVTTNVVALVLSSLVAGAGQGLTFTAGMRAVTAATPLEHRTSVVAAYFVVAYVAISVPPVLAGILTGPMGVVGSTLLFAVVLIALTLFGLTRRREFEGV